MITAQQVHDYLKATFPDSGLKQIRLYAIPGRKDQDCCVADEVWEPTTGTFHHLTIYVRDAEGKLLGHNLTVVAGRLSVVSVVEKRGAIWVTYDYTAGGREKSWVAKVSLKELGLANEVRDEDE